MEREKEVIYTPSAKIRLEKLQQKIKNDIENYLRWKKNIPGDDFVEITASDIDLISSRIHIDKPYRLNSKYMIIIIYGILGICFSVYGLFYEELEKLFFDNPLRLIMFIIGAFFIVFSVVYYSILRQKDKMEKSIRQENELKKYLMQSEFKNDENREWFEKKDSLADDFDSKTH